MKTGGKLSCFNVEIVLSDYLSDGINQKEVDKLQKILSENSAAKAQKKIMKVFFTDTELPEKERKSILQKISDYYRPTEK